LIEQNRRQLHPFARAEHGNRGFGIGGNNRAPAIARGDGGDEPGLCGLIIDQHDDSRIILHLGKAINVCHHSCRSAPFLPRT
jgi:hypothetical protein